MCCCQGLGSRRGSHAEDGKRAESRQEDPSTGPAGMGREEERSCDPWTPVETYPGPELVGEQRRGTS